MNILNEKNKIINLDLLGDETNEYFSSLQYDPLIPANTDYVFNSLLFLETFTDSCIEVLIGGEYSLTIPLSWSIMVGDPDIGEVEVLPIVEIHPRPYDIFCLNPLDGFVPSYKTMEYVGVYKDIRWTFPKLARNQLLTVPLLGSETNKKGPVCIYMTNQKETKFPEEVNIEHLL